MENRSIRRPETTLAWLAIMVILAWFALATQFKLLIDSGKADLPELIIRYFSFFTILTNILVALYCTVILLSPRSRPGRYFSRLSTVTAITFYIVIVGATYNILLRFLWNPEGLQKVVDELLHTVIPSLFLLYWLIFIPKTGLKWSAIFPWMIFPLVYIIYSLIRGSFTGYYPYPFIDVSLYGLGHVLLNSVLFTAAFFVLALLFIGVAKKIGR
ncbi:MAG TPA: Pr6Pr family membrane protein [Puia sp.]|nr:Pr6Pr family membrane protein [Puia sp.]